MVVNIQVPKFGNTYLFIGKWLARPSPVPRVRIQNNTDKTNFSGRDNLLINICITLL